MLSQDNVRGFSISPLQMLESLAMLEQEQLASEVFGPHAALEVRSLSLRLQATATTQRLIW